MSSSVLSPQPSTTLGWTTESEDLAWGHSGYTPESAASGQANGDKSHIWFIAGLPTPPATRVMTGVSLHQHSVYDHRPLPYQPRSLSQDVSTTSTSSSGTNPSQNQLSGQAYWQASDMGHRPSDSRELISEVQERSDDAIAPYLQIPESVNKSKGSLAEFAAEITCLFWFETAATLQYAEDLVDVAYLDRGLVHDATPSIGFRKWVTTILSTTQVSKEVILLALMFIYRLKKFNPKVSGKRGSEFRLLTIALMLGNKFLDDNTYTNKTWAEVSGISVNEIHIMEVEFLSNMRYDLYASRAEWNEWKAKLGKFGEFYNRASKISSAPPVTPIFQSFPAKLPSPPSIHHSAALYSRNNSLSNGYHALPHPLAAATSLPQSPVRPELHGGQQQTERKRSLDLLEDMPPAKRTHHASMPSQSMRMPVPLTTVHTPGSQVVYTPGSESSVSTPSTDATSGLGRIPMLPIPRIQTANGMSGSQLAPLTMPGTRAMSTVYPTSTNGWSQPVTPISSVSSTSLYQNPIPPMSSSSSQPGNYASPVTFAHGGTAPGRPGLSPSYFLTNRSSPYRPVRSVNTLLYPPPAASMQNIVGNITHDQIQYQPLSKTVIERKAGLVPYLPQYHWPQSNASTPLMPHQYPHRST